jgi:putative ABC transport system permease protein
LALNPNDFGRRSDFLLVTGRLAQGATLQSAQAEMTGIAKRLEEKYPASNAGWTVELIGLREQMAGRIRALLLVLTGAVAFILLIACANVANLCLARATARSREMAIRTALGAQRSRIVRQLVTESVLLALIGGAIGALLAVWGVGFIQALSPEGIPRFNEASVDLKVLGFTAILSVVTGILFGVVPAIEASRNEPQSALKEGTRAGASLARGRLRSAFATLEIGLAMTLLVGAGLLVRTLVELNHVEPGFDAKNLLTARIALPEATYGDDEKVQAFYTKVLDEAASLPGVLGTGATSNVPLVGGNYLSFLIEGVPEPAPEVVQDAEVFNVTSGFLPTLRIPVVQGRGFEAQDREGSLKVAVINQTLARRYFPGQDPIGKRMTLGDPKKPESWRTVVGVVGDVRNASLQELPYPQMYLPNAQATRLTMTLAIRGNGSPMALAPALRDIVRGSIRRCRCFRFSRWRRSCLGRSRHRDSSRSWACSSGWWPWFWPRSESTASWLTRSGSDSRNLESAWRWAPSAATF